LGNTDPVIFIKQESTHNSYIFLHTGNHTERMELKQDKDEGINISAIIRYTENQSIQTHQ